MEKGYELVKKGDSVLLTIKKLYKQQLYMYEKTSHTMKGFTSRNRS